MARAALQALAKLAIPGPSLLPSWSNTALVKRVVYLGSYLGLGVTYAKFDGEHSTAVLSGLTGGTPLIPTTLSIQSKLAATMQVGASYKIDERWFVDGAITKTPLKTRNTLSSGQTLDITLNPIGISLGVGMRY